MKKKHLALSFLLPIAILGTAFALHKVFPFGGKQILVWDFWQQYYPFLSSMWHKLREGSLSTWSWTAGLGHDYLSLVIYYMASPLNLPAFILPHAWLRETLTFILLIKIGTAGLFTAIFLNRTFKQDSLPVGRAGFVPVVFSTLYALCAFTLSYYWNIMWFDSFALLPLVMLGLLSLVREGKWKLYVCSLASAVWINFYIGLYICIFTALAFFSLCIIGKFKAKEFLSKLWRTAAFSILAIAITAALILPIASALQSTNSLAAPFPSKLIIYANFFDVLGNFLAFTPPAIMEGLPNIYCGIITILLAGVFFANRKITIREKAVYGVIIIFLLLSCNLNVLNYILNGFRYPNNMPFRFSFLLSFTLVIMAYKVFVLSGGLKKKDLLFMCISAAVVLIAAGLGSHKNTAIIGSAVLCAVYLVIFYALIHIKTVNGKTVIHIILFITIITELSIGAFLSLKTTGTTDRNSYPDRNEQIQALLNQRSYKDNDFYRTEITPYRTENNSSLYNYNGISFFSSTIDDSVTKFVQGLGMVGGKSANIFIGYNMTSPLTNAFLAMRYMLAVSNTPPDSGIFWEAAAKVGDVTLFENKYHLPLGFMANKELSGYKHNAGNPFLSQNELFRRAAGLNGDLFMATNFSAGIDISKMNFIIPYDGMLYVHIKNDQNDQIRVFVNDTFFCNIFYARNRPCITIVNQFKQGDSISFQTDKGSLINLGFFNAELFEQGYALLSDETLLLTHFSETKVSGTVTALNDGILYTSIPGRNWQVTVNGMKRELLLIDNAMAAVSISKGRHTVEFRYVNKSFTTGIIISLVSLAVFILLIFLNKFARNPKNS